MVPSFQILWHLWSTASSTISMSTASSSIASFIPTAFGSLWNSMVPWKAGFGHYFDVASVSSLSVRRLNPSTISMLLASAPLWHVLHRARLAAACAALVGHKRHQFGGDVGLPDAACYVRQKPRSRSIIVLKEAIAVFAEQLTMCTGRTLSSAPRFRGDS